MYDSIVGDKDDARPPVHVTTPGGAAGSSGGGTGPKWIPQTTPDKPSRSAIALHPLSLEVRTNVRTADGGRKLSSGRPLIG